jgi:hypothetical protein
VKPTTFLAFLFAAATSVAASDIVDIRFRDSGDNWYRTTTLSKDLSEKFRIETKTAKVLLVETPSLADGRYVAQIKAFDRLGHAIEEYEILLVVASPDGGPTSGYHVTHEDAPALMGNQPIFRVRLLNAAGVVKKQSLNPIMTKELKRWLENAKK